MDETLKPILLGAKQGLLLDSNLLVIFMLGLVNEKLLGKGVAADYNIRDFLLLQKILDLVKNPVTTPHILAEVSNLASLTKSRDQMNFCQVSDVISKIFLEIQIPFSDFVSHEYYALFGVTDTCIISLAEKENYYVMTNDLPLINHLKSNGKNCFYYNDLKEKK